MGDEVPESVKKQRNAGTKEFIFAKNTPTRHYCLAAFQKNEPAGFQDRQQNRQKPDTFGRIHQVLLFYVFQISKDVNESLSCMWRSAVVSAKRLVYQCVSIIFDGCIHVYSRRIYGYYTAPRIVRPSNAPGQPRRRRINNPSFFMYHEIMLEASGL